MRFVGRRFASWVQSTSPYASARTPQSVSMTSMMPGNDDQENASTGQPGGASRTAAAALGASRPDARPATWLCAVICHMPTQPALGGTACPRSPPLTGPLAHAARPWGHRMPTQPGLGGTACPRSPALGGPLARGPAGGSGGSAAQFERWLSATSNLSWTPKQAGAQTPLQPAAPAVSPASDMPRSRPIFDIGDSDSSEDERESAGQRQVGDAAPAPETCAWLPGALPCPGQPE
jgi:hypothetical protein